MDNNVIFASKKRDCYSIKGKSTMHVLAKERESPPRGFRLLGKRKELGHVAKRESLFAACVSDQVGISVKAISVRDSRDASMIDGASF